MKGREVIITMKDIQRCPVKKAFLEKYLVISKNKKLTS